jgi:isochorismate synthase
LPDLLKYRFPKETAVEKVGQFIDVAQIDHYTGFFIRPFLSDESFGFQEVSNAIFEHFHFSKQIPFVISKRSYLMEGEGFVNAFYSFNIDKAVFSRVKRSLLKSTDLFAAFDALCETYPNALVYLVSSDKFGTWMGASPEILVQQHQNQFFTMSLAGTKKEEKTEWTSKEIIEQQLVTDFIVSHLEKLGVEQMECIGPYDYQTGVVTHLKTDIAFSFDKDRLSDVVSVLDPTPAVSGFPQLNAIQLIQRTESHDRSLYTGIIGYKNENSAKIYVNLRCAQVIDNQLFLYLGGGYTKQSIPEMEWEETENKAKTLENILVNV